MKNSKTIKYKEILEKIFSEIVNYKKWDENSLQKILRKNTKEKGKMFRKDELVEGYNLLQKDNNLIEERIRMKPTRSDSGVTVVTVLTKPFPCPGKCIYCPNDPLMPKSYISSEPGAQRALSNKFDPYAQVYNRLMALKNIGHSIEKIELIVLGGTWNYYPEEYRLSFIHECYRALNDIKKTTTGYIKPQEKPLPKVSWVNIQKQHRINETAYCRNVGLVLETRPDFINKEDLIKMRKLGATKIQIGIQSLSNNILKKNEIGRHTKDTVKAFEILRRMGFKIHGHWMPNLYGSTVNKDITDYKRLWRKPFRPDELKIYPTSVIQNTKLYSLYKKNLHKPYTDKQLKTLFSLILPLTPRYCRLTRIIRDIPSNEISAGNKITNLRQIVENELNREGVILQDIRSREIKHKEIKWQDLELEQIEYHTSVSKEIFLSYKTKLNDKICGFLRLSLPKGKYKKNHFLKELEGNSIIREVHVYGKVVGISDVNKGESQHLGLGKSLMKMAEDISQKNNFKTISVISAIGTKEYYKKQGYIDGELYMHKTL